MIDKGKRYHVQNISRTINDEGIDSVLHIIHDYRETLLRKGMPLNINILNEERNRITSRLRNIGYYRFTPDDIKYRIDTLRGQP